jgi:hypothetical protein
MTSESIPRQSSFYYVQWQATNTSGKICFFRERHATMRLMGGFGFQNGNPNGFCPGKEVPKTIFDRSDQVIVADHASIYCHAQLYRR